MPRKPNLTFAHELRAIRRSAFRTTICVVALVSGIVPAISLWCGYDESFPLRAQVNTFWEVAARTYPLTVSIAVIAMSRQLGWFRYGRLFFMGAVISLGASLAQLTSGWTGQGGTVVAAQMVSTPDHVVFGPLVDSLNYLVGYYRLYGARDFLAAILVGSFVGRTVSKLLRHSAILEEVVQQQLEQQMRDELPEVTETRKAA